MNNIIETTYNLTAYFIYLPIVVVLTFFVGQTLFKNGRFFMLDIFKNNEEIAISTNNLFKLGFYLLNIGFALLILEINHRVHTQRGLVETLSHKIGGFSIYLGITLFFNLFLFMRGRKKSKQKHVTLNNEFDPTTIQNN